MEVAAHHHAGVADGPLGRGESSHGELRGFRDVAVQVRAQGAIAEDQAQHVEGVHRQLPLGGELPVICKKEITQK